MPAISRIIKYIHFLIQMLISLRMKISLQQQKVHDHQKKAENKGNLN